MDGTRFDTLTRVLTTAGSRRRALALAFSGALASLLAEDDAAAHDKSKKCKKLKGDKKKKCLKKAKKHKATHDAQGSTSQPTTPLPPPDPCAGKGEGDSCGTDHACCGGRCVNVGTNPD